MVAPSGSIMRTGGTLAPVWGGSMKVALKPKSVGHFLGFLAVAAFPSVLSTRAYARSPSRPRSVTSLALSSSPSIDLTGYRHSEATEPCVALGMSSSLTYRAQYAPHTAATPDIPVRPTSHGTHDLGAEGTEEPKKRPIIADGSCSSTIA